MTIAPRDYLADPQPQPVPKELAILIVRKASGMAEQFEQQCLDTLIRAARDQLSLGQEPVEIIRQLKL